MQNKCMTILLLVLLVPIFSFAQNTKVQQKKSVVTEQVINTPTVKTNPTYTPSGKMDPGVGESIGLTTWYDVMANSIIRDQIVMYNGIPNFANMVRPYGSTATTVRHVVYTTKDGSGNYVHYDFSGGQQGWPAIDAQLTGTDAQHGTIAVVAHAPNRLGIFDATTGSFSLSENFEAAPVGTGVSGTDPSVQFLGDVIFLASSRNRTGPYDMYKTEDYGSTFLFVDSVETFSPSPIFFTAAGGTELGLSKSADETRLLAFATATNYGAVYEVQTPDSADNAFYLLSTDAGATFTGKVIGRDGDNTQVTGYPDANYAPWFENFGQLDGAVSNTGVVHMVANGYGADLADTTIASSRFPILYWNSNVNTWKSVSDYAVDKLPDSVMAGKRPGNGIGQAWPSVSISADGQVVFIVWQAPEVRNGAVQFDSTDTYYTDLFYVVSQDGGATFSAPKAFANEDHISDATPSSAQLLESLGNNTYRANVVYLKKLIAGSAISDGAAFKDNPIMYKTLDITVTGVNDPSTVSSFRLDQNYPNPFNPSTKITFSLTERSNVSLKVFDMLGREVATLVNGSQESGNHTVSFNASNLASGLYVYTLKAGNTNISKKMMLMK